MCTCNSFNRFQIVDECYSLTVLTDSRLDFPDWKKRHCIFTRQTINRISIVWTVLWFQEWSGVSMFIKYWRNLVESSVLSAETAANRPYLCSTVTSRGTHCTDSFSMFERGCRILYARSLEMFTSLVVSSFFNFLSPITRSWIL